MPPPRIHINNPYPRKSSIRLPYTKLIRAFYDRSPNPALAYLPWNCTKDPNNIFEARKQREIATRARDELWWSVHVPNRISDKAVVRSWCRRRVVAAVREVLKGERDGVVVDGGLAKGGEDGGLRGSLKIMVIPGLEKASYVEVRREVESVVGAIFKNTVRDTG